MEEQKEPKKLHFLKAKDEDPDQECDDLFKSLGGPVEIPAPNRLSSVYPNVQMPQEGRMSFPKSLQRGVSGLDIAFLERAQRVPSTMESIHNTPEQRIAVLERAN